MLLKPFLIVPTLHIQLDGPGSWHGRGLRPPTVFSMGMYAGDTAFLQTRMLAGRVRI